MTEQSSEECVAAGAVKIKRGGRRERRTRCRRLRIEPLEGRRLPAVFTVSNLDDGPVAGSGDAPGTLRQAIFDANQTAGDDEIVFDLALTSGGPATINLSSAGQLEIESNITITGPGASSLTIVAYDLTPTDNNGDGSRVFSIQAFFGPLPTVTIAGLTLTGGDVGSSLGSRGGAIRSGGTLTLRDSVVTGNHVAGNVAAGGGIYANGALTVINSTISNNSVVGLPETGVSGGGIYANGSLTVINSTISNNSVVGPPEAGVSGGGIKVTGGDANISDSSISGNLADADYAYGGGIAAASYLKLVRSIITGNRAEGDSYSYGGGIASQAGAVVSESVIKLNEANVTEPGGFARAGGIGNRDSLSITGSLIVGNQSDGGGGGVFATGSVSISDSTLSENSAEEDGGGIHFKLPEYSDHTLKIVNSTISGNTADRLGGGAHIEIADSVDGQSVISHSTIADNTADSGGGINIISMMQLQIHHVIIATNENSSAPDDISGMVDESSSYNAIGVATIFPGISDGANGNQIGTAGLPLNTLLGALAYNGGLTFPDGSQMLTHALLTGSPAIDAGDSSFDPADPDGDPMTDDALPYDQRGEPFSRMFDGNSNGVARIDIGAYESQPDGTLGDYNRDGGVNAADYVFWRKMFGTGVAPPFVGADGDGNSSVDTGDYGVWEEHFGEALMGSGGSGEWRIESGELRVESGELRVESGGELRVADNGLPIGGSEEYASRRKSVSNLSRPPRGEGMLRDDALGAWWASLASERARHSDRADNHFLSGGEQFEDDSGAISEEMDAVFDTLLSSGS